MTSTPCHIRIENKHAFVLYVIKKLKLNIYIKFKYTESHTFHPATTTTYRSPLIKYIGLIIDNKLKSHSRFKG